MAKKRAVSPRQRRIARSPRSDRAEAAETPPSNQAAGASGEPAPPSFVPWGYGRDVVRAAAVDPDRLHVYWEVTDEAKERAKRDLGPDGASARLTLRVYDTTGRLFDGTNAHGSFDHPLEDGARQRFLDVGKPGSDAVVEIGMKSLEGAFVRIARSKRVSFPRRSPAPAREPQWLTVRAVAHEPVPKPKAPIFSPPPGRVVETYRERESRFEVDGRKHVSPGVWNVVVQEPGPFEEPRIVSRWTIRASRAFGAGPEPQGLEGAAAPGASERRFGGASERRLGGASGRP